MACYLFSLTFNLSTLRVQSRDVDVAWGVAVARKRDAPGGRGQGVAPHPLGPLDDEDSALVHQQFVQVNGVRRGRALAQTVEVHVVELEPPLVVDVDEREGRARHFVRVYPERVGQPLG